jgi:L-amino acid N-acyltransferase YncA
MNIIPMQAHHWNDVARIYAEGIASGIATLTTDTPSWEEWDSAHLPICRFVALDHEQVLGWVALANVSGRCVYEGVAEVSVYIGENARGRGVGKALMLALIEDSEKQKLWTLQSGILSENKTSIALHEKVGFRVVGFREKLGKLHDVWRDIVLMERRSDKVW